MKLILVRLRYQRENRRDRVRYAGLVGIQVLQKLELNSADLQIMEGEMLGDRIDLSDDPRNF
jgi:hypothetical protein